MKTTRRCLCKTISFLLALSILFCCCPIVPLADGSVHSGGRSTPMRDPSSPYWDDFWGINPTDAELEAFSKRVDEYLARDPGAHASHKAVALDYLKGRK